MYYCHLTKLLAQQQCVQYSKRNVVRGGLLLHATANIVAIWSAVCAGTACLTLHYLWYPHCSMLRQLEPWLHCRAAEMADK